MGRRDEGSENPAETREILVDTGGTLAIDGWVYTRSCKMKCKDVLLRVPKTCYFRTRYREMPLSVAHLSEIVI